MKRTDKYRYDILCSLMRRYERVYAKGPGDDPGRDLSNVSKTSDGYSIAAATGKTIVFGGSFLSIDEVVIPIGSIDQIEYVPKVQGGCPFRASPRAY